MKNKFLIIFIIIIVISCLLFIGCSTNSPAAVVYLYGQYMKNGDYSRMYDLMSKESRSGQTKDEFVKDMVSSSDKATELMLKNFMKNVNMQPVKTIINGDEALVTTEITTPDFGKIMEDLMPKLFELALTNENIDEEANNLLLEYFKENKIETTTATRDIKLLKEDGWKIDINSFELFDFSE